MGKALLCGMIFDDLSNFVSWFKEDSCMMLTANLYCGSVKMLELALGKLQPVSCHNHQTNLELSRWWLFWVCIFFFLFSFFFEWKNFIKKESWETTLTSSKITSKRFRGAEHGPKKPKMLFSKDQWANIWGSPVSNSRDPIKRDRSIIITVY